MERDQYLENARKCFRQATQAANASSMELFAEMGLEYLRIAHEHAALVTRSAAEDAFVPICETYPG